MREDDAVYRRHPLQRPALGIGLQELIDGWLHGDDTLNDFHRVRVNDEIRLLPTRLERVESRNGTLLRLEKYFKCPATGFTACAH